jgi:hypothetical protein
MKLKLITYILISIVFIFAGEAVASENTETNAVVKTIEDTPKDIAPENNESAQPILKTEGETKTQEVEKEVADKLEKVKKEDKTAQTKPAQQFDLYGSKKYKSLFFTKKEMDNLISIFRDQKLKSDTSQEQFSLLDVVEGQQKISTVIFLNSILFLNKNNWTIWVNDKRMSSDDEGTNDLKVLSITNSKVKFLWKVSRTKWEIMMPNFNFEKSISKLTEDNSVETVFTLQTNQTFIPQTGDIIEGRKAVEQNSAPVVNQNTQQNINGTLQTAPNGNTKPQQAPNTHPTPQKPNFSIQTQPSNNMKPY